MKKTTVLVALALSVALAVPTLAAEWKQDAKGWWYQNDDGSYPVNQWQNIDGADYYFGADGYMLADTYTPDGWRVGPSGNRIPFIEHHTDTYDVVVYDYALKHSNKTGQPAIEFYYYYTNKSDRAMSAYWETDMHFGVFQDGVEIERASLRANADAEYDNLLKNVLTGTTIPVGEIYFMNDEVHDVVLQLTDYTDFSNIQKKECVFKIASRA